ncbi:SDR family oxidoreductase [bacterium]|nr:SDR family oxidoreductase [bacterium]
MCVLITGGRRVGADLAMRLGARNARIAMTYRTSREEIEATLQEASARWQVRTLAIPADLADATQAARAVEATIEAFGRIDALVNMASIFPRTPFESLKPEDFDRNIAANLAGPYHTAVAAGQAMLGQADGPEGLKGRIVNIGDWAIDRPYRDYLPYLVAKGGLKTMTLALAAELAPHVTVNMIQPAMIDPPPHMSAADIDEVIAATPLRRVGNPGDVNRLIEYLLTGTAFVTGTCIRVDGGRFLNDGGPTERV